MKGEAQRPLLITAGAYSLAINAKIQVSDGYRYLR